MSIQHGGLQHWHRWNWSGDEILPDTIIPGVRYVPGSKRVYEVDIREFLLTTDNAVVRREVETIIRGLGPEQQALFRSRAPSSFDFRVDQVLKHVGNLRYRPSRKQRDPWLFPDETLSNGGGDCEDLAITLAALLLASGVSSYCIRVALGRLYVKDERRTREHDHTWVMYLNELGNWEILEPLASVGKMGTAQVPRPEVTVDYVPHFVFNPDHLWRIRSDENHNDKKLAKYISDRGFWSGYNPTFAAGVHSDIFERALKQWIPDQISTLKRYSLYLDVNVFAYHPFDHFDNGFIDEGWERVQKRLNAFDNDKSDWASLAYAGHAIADFYSHSSYVHFARLVNPGTADGYAQPYQPGVVYEVPPNYGANSQGNIQPFDLTGQKFSINSHYWNGPKAQIPALWDGKIISGRYAQNDDSHGMAEAITYIPDSLLKASFKVRGVLPHHNEIAVDEATMDTENHKLYSRKAADATDRMAYKNQFRWRENSAINHIKQEFNKRFRP